MLRFKKAVANILSKSGWEFARYGAKEAALQFDALIAWSRILELYPDVAPQVFSHFRSARAQLGQDLFALIANDFQSHGYFVEIGATDGVALSNTKILESDFGWTGILVEPGEAWQSALRINRSAAIDSRAVWSTSGEKKLFVEAGVLGTFGENIHSGGFVRRGKKRYVETISSEDLLSEHLAPEKIDFLSVDTEGSEAEIIESFPFERYDVTAICVEHNFNVSRSLIQRDLSDRGFERVFSSVSAYDDWFVKRERNERLCLPA